MADLSTVLEDNPVRLEPLAAHHLEPLRAACAEDPDIWQIYPVNMLGEGFDQAMAEFHGFANWVRFAVIDMERGRVVGMTNYINPDRFGAVEIGGTYISPSVRGTGFNRQMKKLLIEHAFAHGFNRIEFRVDTRNIRSMAAVAKLGAVREGTLRRNRVTWTGYIRDTAVFGLLRDEWAG
ncbi:GNAT family protein [Allopontixanthobacter sp.]|uniref:GNAT family N-acetyltransferase n=1 Tax=Allopontixanthobacter sp. TaxID=2906452 RepID=UPI002ABBBE1E|nr:GNAT family protein [Allopontixanthobacter sp.]MDZ4308224.1 GNAT family protein [Allopontixanthobacter sp.]